VVISEKREVEMKYCPQCQFEYKDEIIICADCKTLLTNTPPAAKTPQIKKPLPAYGVLVFIASGLSLLFGVTLLMYSWGFHRFETPTSRWFSVQGKVVASEVKPSAKWNIKDAYYCAITYEYVVDHKTFTKESAYHTSHAFNSRAEAENVIKQYPLGAVVSLSYNPEKPYEFVESTRKRLGVPFFIFHDGATFFCLLGFALLYVGIMIARKKEGNGTGEKRSIGVTIFGMLFILDGVIKLMHCLPYWKSLGWFSYYLVCLSACMLILGINILLLKEWSRKGVIFFTIFSALIQEFSFPLSRAFDQLQNIQMIYSYYVAAVLWIVVITYFFTRPKVKAQFVGTRKVNPK
jgi:hypothetical protein